MRNLYKFSLHGSFQENVRRAIEEVERLDRQAFTNPALAGHLQKITEKYSLDVARIHRDDITARRRDTERDGTDAWGDRRAFRQTWLDVTLPFSGDKDSFLLSPSRTTIPSCDAEVGSSSLKISIPDDDGADNAVQSFIRIIRDNLEVLRTEYDQLKPQLVQAVNQAAQRRKQQIDTETARDQTRSFKVVG